MSERPLPGQAPEPEDQSPTPPRADVDAPREVVEVLDDPSDHSSVDPFRGARTGVYDPLAGDD